jgi:leucine-rich repeat protein SHOC2
MEQSELTQIIERARLDRAFKLDLNGCQLTILPESIGDLINLRWLHLDRNQLTTIPDSIGNLTNLRWLALSNNQLTILPESIGNLTNLGWLYLNQNQLSALPISTRNFVNLTNITLSDNPLSDLSVLQNLPNLIWVWFLNVYLPRRYWTNYHDWKSEWLLDEANATIRSTLIGQLGYGGIFKESSIAEIDT